jgi:hypothetical protein
MILCLLLICPLKVQFHVVQGNPYFLVGHKKEEILELGLQRQLLHKFQIFLHG